MNLRRRPEGDRPCASSGSDSRPGAAAPATSRGKPRVDPPEYADRVNVIFNKDPYWIPGAFPGIFQNETGDPYNCPLKEGDLVTWGTHILRSRGWHAQAHMTFMYWWMNMVQRIKALAAKQWYSNDTPTATGFTVSEIRTMGPPSADQ